MIVAGSFLERCIHVTFILPDLSKKGYRVTNKSVLSEPDKTRMASILFLSKLFDA